MTDGGDVQRIRVTDLEQWAIHLGVSRETLAAAVAAVGTRVAAVEAYLDERGLRNAGDDDQATQIAPLA